MEENVQERIQTAANEVFEAMAPRVSAEDLSRIRRAFEFARAAHEGQKRMSGEPYIMHPIAVARIVAKELELDANPVIAAFLHDVVEDTDATIEDIRTQFGDDVAFLVDAVTKRKKEKYEYTKQVDNFRQIIESVHYDVRALLVKLSDRLHNMRTLDSMRPDKQMKIAGETDFFYAPLANRLGLYPLKSELENLSFRYRCPREFVELEQQLAQDRERTAKAVEEFSSEIRAILLEKGIEVRTETRYRKPYSIWRDMQEDGVNFSHVDFKHYIRVIYSLQGDQWSEKDMSLYIYSLLSSRFQEKPGSITNYIDHPKDNGYQGFHVTMLNRQGAWEQLHISSERMMRNARLGCVVERDEAWLERFKAVLQDMAEHLNPLDFMEGVNSSFYNEDIIAYTPNGRGVILPKGATALDFAYEIHTDIAERAKFARINGKLFPLKTELHRGDCVEIGVADDARPNPEWKSFVTTYKAKKHLANYLKHLGNSDVVRCPLCLPLPGDEVIGFRGADGVITIHSRHCTEAIKLASEKGDSIVNLNFKEEPDKVYPASIKITAVDRYHLLRDIIDCIVEQRHLSMSHLTTFTEDQIVTCEIGMFVHSADEFQQTISGISAIPGVDEVQDTTRQH
ncbi:MAG: bifunctional (p)ppGpp synthetase/guanosine-3',5'-bis(diphosphate) 3'-pyrophosphohydrolase [Bacteroidales bacterium]|nr:bifunctional (p)ppGpp synthetase/guanosine-3',5'-bis(diphosphate) 3'-pyrophosphohydrolase [Bacteroidales bacterium]